MGEAFGTPKHRQAMSRQPMEQMYPKLTDDDDETDDEFDDGQRACVCDRPMLAKLAEAESRRQTRNRKKPVLNDECSVCGGWREATKTLTFKECADKPRQDAKGTSSKSLKHLLFLSAIGVICLILFGSVRYYWYKDIPTTPEDGFEKVRKAFEADLGGIRANFAKQPKASWLSIRAVVRMTTEKRQPTSPGVISLIPSYEPGAEETARCLAKKLAVTLQKSYNDSHLLEIDGQLVGSGPQPADHLTLQLEQKIRNSLNNNAVHVIFISNLDRLPAKTGMLLHGLCDTENAPFKQAIYILTVGRQATMGDAKSAVVDVVNAQVTMAWKSELLEEERQSLETRIGNNIVLVMPELKDILEQIC